MFVLFFGSGPRPWGSQVLSTPEERKSENSDRWPTTPIPLARGWWTGRPGNFQLRKRQIQRALLRISQKIKINILKVQKVKKIWKDPEKSFTALHTDTQPHIHTHIHHVILIRVQSEKKTPRHEVEKEIFR